MTERARNTGIRLAYEVPLTLWPILIRINQMGEYPWSGGRHSATALVALGDRPFWSLLCISLLAMTILLAVRPGTKALSLWTIFVLANAFLIFQYYLANANVYI